MKKLHCVICDKYRKSEKPKIFYLLEKTLLISIICSKCKNKDKKILKEEQPTEIIENIIENLIENI